MKILITLLATLTFSPLLAADDLADQIRSACASYKKRAIEHENKGGTLADLRVLNEARKRSTYSKVPHTAIRRNSLEGLENPHSQEDVNQLKKWEKRGLVQKAMFTWQHADFVRNVMIYQPTKK